MEIFWNIRMSTICWSYFSGYCECQTYPLYKMWEIYQSLRFMWASDTVMWTGEAHSSVGLRRYAVGSCVVAMRVAVRSLRLLLPAARLSRYLTHSSPVGPRQITMLKVCKFVTVIISWNIGKQSVVFQKIFVILNVSSYSVC